jgi:hypothetical protein
MANEGLGNLPDRFPVVDWELERCPMQADLLLRFRYSTQAMQDLDEATRGPVYVLDRSKAIDLRDALDAALKLDAVLRRQ